MAKDKKKGKKEEKKDNVKLIGISQTGKKVIAAGFLILIAGFFVLSKTDPAGQNWAGVLSPFLILGGYAVIGIGIITPDKSESQPAVTEKKT